MINLSDVEIILEIAKAKSISKAAENLYMSQPNLSKKLKQFEASINMQLFERKGSGIQLTYDGRRFVDATSTIMNELRTFEKTLTNETQDHSLELNIASTSFYFMRPAIAELCKRYPSNPLKIKYFEISNEDQIEFIEKGRLDIGIVSLNCKDVGKTIRVAKLHGVEYHTLCRAKTYICISNNSNLYPKYIDYIDPTILSKMMLVSISPPTGIIANTSNTWDYVSEIIGMEKGCGGSKEIRTNNTGTAHQLVILLDGFTIVVENEGLYRQYDHYKDVRLIGTSEEQEPNYELGWFQLANSIRSPLANEFINLLQEHASL